MNRRVLGLMLALAIWAVPVLAGQRVVVTMAAGEDRAAALGRAFDEALALEVRAVTGTSLPETRLQAVMEILSRERDALVLGYSESVPDAPADTEADTEAGAAADAPADGNATARSMTLDVRVHVSALKARLRELGVLSTLSGPLPYVLQLSGVEPSRTKRLGALQALSGLTPVAAAGPDVPVLTLSQVGNWTGVLSLGDWSATRTAKTLDEVWLAVWKEYFSRSGAVSAGGAGLEVRISGWLSSSGPMEFDSLLAGWASEVDHAALVGVEMDGPGMAGVWRIQTRSREALVRRLEDAAKARGLTVEVR